MTEEEQSLNDMMQPDHVIRVNEDGSITDDLHNELWAPELSVHVDEHGQLSEDDLAQLHQDAEAQGWTLWTGYPMGTFSRNDPLMHPSQYVGGSLEDDIRRTAGYYCVVHVDTDEEEPQPAGWAVCHRES